MTRTTFLIDGFNLYHSARQASYDLGLAGTGTKWLDIGSLCHSYLHLIGRSAHVTEIVYFSALARHMEATRPDSVRRHSDFIECLRATGVKVELGRFKEKTVWCNNCRTASIHHEEKETDVAIGIRLLELLFTDSCDSAFLMTGDTDIAPAVRTAQRLFPDKEIGFIFPYRRKNKELAQLVSKCFQIKRDTYSRFQFPDPLVAPDGRVFPKPISW